MKLRPYQEQLTVDIDEAFTQGACNVLAVMPTGAGKTVTFAHITAHADKPVALLAHRTELVQQISMTLARFELEHRIIAPPATVRAIRAEHFRAFQRTFENPLADHGVGSVDTLMARSGYYENWATQVGTWIIDEAAHVVGNPPNKWGKCVQMFDGAKGIGFTATPCRADGKGLGRVGAGVFDVMVQGPTTAWLIANGHLSRYKIIAKPSDMRIEDLKATAAGDFSAPKLRARSHESHIVGDVVQEYLKHASGLQGITFTVDVETCVELAEAFNAAGVPAAAVSAKTPERERTDAIRAFREGRLKQLTNCDLFGEGFDVPGVEVVSLARPTMSLGLYLQQVGRALRPADGKDHAKIIDHVGNWERHGLPDSPRVWTLASRTPGERREQVEAIKLTVCVDCALVFERKYLPTCPHCGYHREPSDRSGPEHVDGDLTEIDPAVLDQLRERVELDSPDLVAGRAFHAGGQVAANSARKRHCERIQTQMDLKEAIAWWAGHRKHAGEPESVSYRDFYLTYGVDVLTAQTLTTKQMRALIDRLEADTPEKG